MTCDSGRPTLDSLCRFVSRYSAVLLGAGATCIRIEKNISRIADAYGMDIEMTIMPRHVHITVRERDSGRLVTSIATVTHAAISFNINTRLSQLSWAIADGRLSFDRAKEVYEEIVSEDSQSRWLVLLLVTLANASFCRLFGGDFIAMGIVAAATCTGYYLKQQLLAHGCDVRVMFMICAFVSAVLGASGLLFGLGVTPQVALGTSVLYLVPGIPLLNSFSDMLYRHYLCAFSRFADAMVLTACLSIGLCAAMMLMQVGMF